VRALASLALATTALITAPATTGSQVTLHQAKVRTFRALLAITERRPDAADATRANVTVQQCKRSGAGYLCHGTLAPVAFSGIDGSTCPFLVYVTPTRTHVTDSPCR
jgi:hypothetical protein